MSRSVILSVTLPQVPISIVVVKIVKYVKIASFSAGWCSLVQQLDAAAAFDKYSSHTSASAGGKQSCIVYIIY